MTFVELSESGDPTLYGGKAAQLATALRAGLPVPPGVALSTAFVDDVARAEQAAIERLGEACARLSRPLAVRSSAVGEDSETASFAGQHLTCLNVRTSDELVEAVGAVHASAHSEAALAYRARLVVAGEPQIAAVVQELVEPECAGVLFTRNPLDGTDEVMIEASWGLGEAVVAGLVTPDRFRLSRDGSVLEREAGIKDIALKVALNVGTEETAVEPERARTLCLSDAQLSELHRLALRCEEVFGGGRDVEWAYAGRRLWLLQCRAMTRVPSAS